MTRGCSVAPPAPVTSHVGGRTCADPSRKSGASVRSMCVGVGEDADEPVTTENRR